MSHTITPTCPECRRAIARDDVNVGNDVAYCRSCHLAHALSELVHAVELEAGVDFRRPPAGVRYNEGGGRLVVAASHRSPGAAFGILFFALFWNGIVSVFVLFAIAATLANLGIPLPGWFPAPDMDGSPMGVGMTIFLWVFLTPFIAVGVSVMGAFLMNVAGKTEVRIDRSHGTVFTGIGPLGFRRRFVPSTVSDVRIDGREWRDSDGDSQQKVVICIETREGAAIRFGAGLAEERRKFVAAAVRRALVG